MAAGSSTKVRLLHHARRLFWSRGYSNVSLRQIAGAAGVDVALISRHFGGKLGLFEATLERAFRYSGLPQTDTDALVDAIVRIFVEAPRDSDDPSIVRMILMNAHDPEVGGMVRARHRDILQSYLDQMIGDKERAALFMAVLLGISVAEKSLRLDGIASPETSAYESQLRYLMDAALAYKA